MNTDVIKPIMNAYEKEKRIQFVTIVLIGLSVIANLASYYFSFNTPTFITGTVVVGMISFIIDLGCMNHLFMYHWNRTNNYTTNNFDEIQSVKRDYLAQLKELQSQWIETEVARDKALSQKDDNEATLLSNDDNKFEEQIDTVQHVVDVINIIA